MLERHYGKVVFVCDDCGEELQTGTENFNEALVTLRKENWDSYRDRTSTDDDDWCHSCPDCA